jgi:phosphoglycerol transferase MdoB-like AlkP superfamily enzyme
MNLTETLKISVNGNYLHIAGCRLINSYSSALAFTRDICQLIENRKAYNLVLIDYTNFISIITCLDVFNIVRINDLKSDFCRTIRLSLIVDKNDIEIAKYWEDLCQKRGFNFKVFLTYCEGKKWLLEGKLNHSRLEVESL